MNYKSILCTKTRHAILNALAWVPDSIMIRLEYRIKMGFFPNLYCAQRYTEKIQYYKLKYRDPLMHTCVDKYDVRGYLNSIGLGNLLNECYGVYNTANEIDFNILPNSFVIKTTHGGGGNNVMLIHDKTKCDYTEIKKKLTQWLKSDISNFGREWAYKNLKHRIIIEKLLTDDSNPDSSIDDYKFLCFDGKFKYLWVDKNRFQNHQRGFWDENLIFLNNVESDHNTFTNVPALPKNITTMIQIAEKVATGFPHARIDLYNIKGEIIFGEITFYPWSGYVHFNPETFDYTLGKEFKTNFDNQ